MGRMAGRLGRMAVAALMVAPFSSIASPLARAESPRDAGASGDQTSDALSAARALFADALRDEEAGRFPEALEKFRRVRDVRDTPPIEYRIGRCYEELGQPVPAFAAYRAAKDLARDDSQWRDVAGAATERLEALAARLARLTLVMPPMPDGAADAEVRVDEEVIAPAALRAPIPLPAGRHMVVATAPRTVPFRSEIVLAEGAQVSVVVLLEPMSTAPDASGPASRSPARTAGWIVLGGAVLVSAASVVLLVIRHDDIAHLDQACPGGRCPPGADAAELQSTRSRALAEGPAAIGCGVAGLAAAGVGAYLLLAARVPASSAASWLRPYVAPDGAGVALAGTLP